MITKQTFARGGKNSVKVIIDLAKFFVPAVFLMNILEHSGWLMKIADFFAPYMSYLGLPGEGALVFLLGQVSMYSSVAAIATLGWTAKQVTIVAVLITMFHAILVESAVVGRGGANGLLNAVVRLIAAILAGMALNLIIPGV